MSFDFNLIPEHFSGTVPIFPLPNLVLFPHVAQPLHIFEPRYIAMFEHALAGNRLIAMALLQPGWETATSTDSVTPSPIHPIVCLGRISAEERLPNGRYNCILQGLLRARVITEEKTAHPYRTAELELLRDSVTPGANDNDRRNQLIQAFRRLFPKLAVEREMHRLFEADFPLGVLCDVMTSALNLDPELAQQILNEFDIERRSNLLLKCISQLHPITPREFPPKFSLN